jgi:Ala-tRNA(Pro) deacylase
MFKVSDPVSTAPAVFATELQRQVYETFARLGIPFERVDTDPGLTMDDCRHIDAKIGVRIVKTLFLCNRQQTDFYLYVTTDDKPFVTRDFCSSLGIARVSFAPANKLWELTGVEVGATTILSAVLPQSSGVRLIMDAGVAASEWFACTDGTPTCFVKISTHDLLKILIPATGHDITII